MVSLASRVLVCSRITYPSAKHTLPLTYIEIMASTKSSRAVLGGRTVEAQVVDFLDRKLIFIRVDGELDSSFDVKAPDSNTIMQLGLGGGADDFTCEKVCLMGDNTNLKLSIMVNQVAKLLYAQSETRNLIVSLSSKLFDEKADGDGFGRLVDVLELLKNMV